MLLIIIGKTCAGKDKIVTELIDNGFDKVTTYTTRPSRKGEVPGHTYNFITEEDFEQKIQDSFFLEYKTYEVADGSIWFYGTSINSFDNIEKTDKKVIILTPDGYRDFLQKVFIPHKSIYVKADDVTIKTRLIERGDNKNESERRIKHDDEDFRGIEDEVDQIIYNNNCSDIKYVVNSLLITLEKDNE